MDLEFARHRKNRVIQIGLDPESETSIKGDMASERGSMSEASPRCFSTEFKVALVKRVEGGEVRPAWRAN